LNLQSLSKREVDQHRTRKPAPNQGFGASMRQYVLLLHSLIVSRFQSKSLGSRFAWKPSPVKRLGQIRAAMLAACAFDCLIVSRFSKRAAEPTKSAPGRASQGFGPAFCRGPLDFEVGGQSNARWEQRTSLNAIELCGLFSKSGGAGEWLKQ
jgi:hypothetical protein